MSVIKINQKALERTLRARFRALPKRLLGAMNSDTRRALAILKANTPVASGELKNSWKVTNRLEVENSAPHAGVIEFGARPHSVSADGIANIKAWALSVFPNADNDTINNIVWGVVHKLKEEGQAPTYFVRDSLDEIKRSLGAGITANLNKFAAQRDI